MKRLLPTSLSFLVAFALFFIPLLDVSGQPRDVPRCEDFGAVLIAKFEWNGNQYRFEEPENNEGIVTIIKGTESKIKFVSSVFIGNVILYGGRDHKVVEINGTEGKVTNEGMENRGGQTPDISNVQFCSSVPPPDPCPPDHPPTVEYLVREENGDYFLDVRVEAAPGVELTRVEFEITGTDITFGVPVTDGLVLVESNEQFAAGFATYTFEIVILTAQYDVVFDVEDECEVTCPVNTVPEIASNPPINRTTSHTVSDDHPIVTFEFFVFFQSTLTDGPHFNEDDTEVTFEITVDPVTEPGLVGFGLLAANACNALVYDPPLAVNGASQNLTSGSSNTSINIGLELPAEVELSQNYPNPFNPATSIGFALPEAAHVTLVVYDVLGREVAVLVDGGREAGHHSVVFDAGHLPGGTYIYRLAAGEVSHTRKLLLIK